MMSVAHNLNDATIFNLGGTVYAFDATTVELWSSAGRSSGRKVVKWKRRMPKNVLSDSIIELTTYKSLNDYPEQLSRIEYYDEEQDRYFVFLTNAMNITALEVVFRYKSRWSVALFFK